MNLKIEKAIAQLPADRQLNINDARLALSNGWAESVEFYPDGSGICVTYSFYDVNGVPSRISSSFPINEAVLVLSGFRLKSHDHPKCA